MKPKPWVDYVGIVWCVAMGVGLLLMIPPDWSVHQWYYEQHAFIPHGETTHYFNDDIVGRFFSWLAYEGIELWNALFARDFVRVTVPWAVGAICVGFLGKLGSDLYDAMKKASEAKKGYAFTGRG